MLRAAFLSHPAATEEDFERCWPELRDEVLMRHALTIYRKMRLEVKKREAGEGAAVSGDEAGPAGKEKGGPV